MDLFNQIISLENLFLAWDKFKKGKGNKLDVQEFEFNLEKNIFQLHKDLKNRCYIHSPYESFFIKDPKRRNIHKATVRDRVVHHAIFAIINPIFEPTFISNSFSCRVGKGNHKGVDALARMIRKASNNGFKNCFILKCDIKNFFGTIDHRILLDIVRKRIKDDDSMRLLEEIIESFSSQYSTLFERKGLPIGNLTSQLFANIYLNKFDQFIKHKLRIKNYLRYTDDFVILSGDKIYLGKLISTISLFLSDNLALKLHPKKVTIRKFHQGIDFLGYILLPHYRLLRAKTRRRIFRKIGERIREYKNGTISEQSLVQSLQSYLGVLSHANTYELEQELRNQFWFWLNSVPSTR